MKAIRRMGILPVLLALSMFLVVFISACAGPPDAQVTASVTTGQAPLSVSFTSQSKNADEVRWDFGDGATATTTKEKKTTHEYTKAGAHAVTLTAVKKGEPPQTSTASINITVEPGPLDRVKIDPPVATVEVAKEVKLAATAVDRFDNPIPNLSYAFRSDEKAGKVDPEGKFTAGASAGSYESGLTVEVVQGSATRAASAKVTVKPGPLDRVNIDPGQATVEVTKGQKFTATALDRFDNPIPDLSYTFGSDKGAGQVTSEGGLTTGTKAGVYPNGVTVAATQGSVTKTATAPVTVRPGPLDRVKLEPDSATVEVVNKEKFTGTALDQFDNPIAGLTYAFRSQAGAGRVEQDGEFTAGSKTGSYPNGLTVEVAQGAVTRTATARLTLRHGPLDRVLLTPATVILDIDKTQQFRAEVTDSYDNPILEAKVTWQVADQVGTIHEQGLLRTKTKAGTFGQSVKATAAVGKDSKEATGSVTIKPGPPVALSIPPVELAAGEAQQLNAFVADRYGNPVDEVKVTLTVRDANAGSLSATSLFTAGKVAGKFDKAIDARSADGGLNTTTSVTIRPGPLAQVVIAPNRVAIGMGMTQQFVAVGADRYGNRLSGLTWTWVATAKAGGIDGRGLLTAGTRPEAYGVVVAASQGTLIRNARAGVNVEPDRILFLSDRSGRAITTTTDGRSTTFKTFGLHRMNIDGTNVQSVSTALTFIEGHSSTPDGRRIVWEAGNVIWASSVDMTWDVPLHRESYAAFHPAVSPDGTKVAYHSHEGGFHEIYVMDIDGGNRKRLTNNAANVDDDQPAWSADGKQIVFVSDRDGNDEIYVMNADGSNQRRLTNHPNIDGSPQWSPDGAEILFDSDRDGDFEVYIMRADGTNLRQLTSNSVTDGQPSWSPDGARITFISNRDGNGEIYVMDQNGANVTRLTNNTALDFSPLWAPRKRGLEVSEASVVIPNASALRPTTAQEVMAKARGAVVRIKTNLASGSGFVIDPNGLVLTNNHVISDAKEITVYLEDGRNFKGKVQGRDLLRDLAVVKIEASNLPTLELGDVSQVQLVSDLLVVGYPLGSISPTVTRGVASAFKPDTGRNTLIVQTDSAVNPGNSGGPLLNLQGQVIGVVSAKLVGLSVENVGFAVSANTVKLYLERLSKGEVITA